MHTPESYYFGALKRALEGDLEGAFSLHEKAEEVREVYGYSFSEAVSDNFPYIGEAVTTLLSSYNFTRCVRPDGSAYGTKGKCRKGSQAEKKPDPSQKKTAGDTSYLHSSRSPQQIAREAKKNFPKRTTASVDKKSGKVTLNFMGDTSVSSGRIVDDHLDRHGQPYNFKHDKPEKFTDKWGNTHTITPVKGGLGGGQIVGHRIEITPP